MNLEFLNAEGNLLKHLQGIENCKKLSELYAPDNQIESIVCGPGLKLLKVVDLRNNKIQKFEQIMSLAQNPVEIINLMLN